MTPTTMTSTRCSRRAVAPLVALAALVAGTTRPAAALPLAYEGFQYLPGTVVSAMAGGSGWAGAWTGSQNMVDTPPSLASTLALPSAGDSLANSSVGEAFRSFGAALNNLGNELWVSFLEETTVLGSGASMNLVPVGGFPGVVINKDTAGQVTLGGPVPPVLAGPSSGVGNTDFFVLRLSAFTGSTTVDLFVNPAAGFGVPNATFSVPSAFAFTQLLYLSDPGEVLDEIRIGTTPLDVSAVPEPSTALLLGLGIAAVSAWSRHRQFADDDCLRS